MKRLMTLMLCAAVVGCATFSAKRYERATDTIVSMINAGDADGLAELSQTPFLLDGELIMLPQDVATFWQNVVGAGFRVESMSDLSAQPLDGGSYSQFADTMEVQTFFEKYVSDIGSVVVLRTEAFQLLLLLDRDGATTTIVGFKGPEAL